MSLYRKKQSESIEAITFKELIDYGRENGANIVNGMPWSFEYKGRPVSHETDSCYLIGMTKLRPGHILVISQCGTRHYTEVESNFLQTHELVTR